METRSTAPVFYWNGIKDAKGAKLQRCFYSQSPHFAADHRTIVDDGQITIYARDYKHFSALVREHFAVENDSDSMTDYFESDRIRVPVAHPLYAAVKAAKDACDAHYTRRAA